MTDTVSILPIDTETWPRGEPREGGIPEDQDDFSQSQIDAYLQGKPWQWTGRLVYFFCDIHSDADAFLASLEASGGIKRTGPCDSDFDLTIEGKEALFIVGGDCFDKGPSTLRLLDVLADLRVKEADLVLLAGNHDIRTFLGVHYAENKEPLLDHLFTHMGTKAIPLFKEIYEKYIEPDEENRPDIEQILLPDDNWSEQFSLIAEPWIKPARLASEIRRVTEKTELLRLRIEALGLNFSKVAAAMHKFKELFFAKDGPYYWFFDSMKLAHREGSYLFVHAGLDDSVAKIIAEQGVQAANDRFHEVVIHDPFELYQGAIGNVFRTKYRDSDLDFTASGGDCLHQAGIFAIVHGHRNIKHGQRMLIRQGMLNFECDASVDCNTRKRIGLVGLGAAVVVFQPDGSVKGISTDYPYIKLFKPELTHQSA